MRNLTACRRTQIVPIGALFSGSLIFSNFAYLSLSVSFIQMLVYDSPLQLQPCRGN